MDLLKQIMQMVLSLIELGKILFHYSCYKYYFMLPSTLRQRNTFLFERLTNTPLYTNAFCNHPQKSNHQKLPKMINKRISDLSCNKEEFDKVYETALKDSEQFSLMSLKNSNTQIARRNRNRKVIWFNPPLVSL